MQSAKTKGVAASELEANASGASASPGPAPNGLLTGCNRGRVGTIRVTARHSSLGAGAVEIRVRAQES